MNRYIGRLILGIFLAIYPTYNIVHALFTDLNFDRIGTLMFPFILGWGIIVESLVKILKLRRKNDEQL